MATHTTTIYSNIRRSKITGAIFAGNQLLHRVRNVRCSKPGLFRKLEVVNVNGDVWEVVQLDIGYFELRGPHLGERGYIECDSYADGVRLVESI